MSNNIELETLNARYCYLPYVDLSNNSKLNNVDLEGNLVTIGAGTATYMLSGIGFDPAKVSNVSGAPYDAVTGTFTLDSGILLTEEYAYYTYDTGYGVK